MNADTKSASPIHHLFELYTRNTDKNFGCRWQNEKFAVANTSLQTHETMISILPILIDSRRTVNIDSSTAISHNFLEISLILSFTVCTFSTWNLKRRPKHSMFHVLKYKLCRPEYRSWIYMKHPLKNYTSVILPQHSWQNLVRSNRPI